MNQYHDFLEHILSNGHRKEDRTGTGTISTFGYQMRFDLGKGFPLVTTKKLSIESIVHELLWFISGNTNIAYLQQNDVKIWDSWATPNGDLGPVYGEMWRSWPCKSGATIDQLAEVIHEIKVNPDSRRLIVSSWNPELLPNPEIAPSTNAALGLQALPPCHTLFQFYVLNGKLSCQLYQRSGDAFLGIPFNIASYALLTHMVAHVTGLEVGEFIHTIGDAHIYLNHLDQVKEQLSRDFHSLPSLILPKHITDINDFERDDILFLGYRYHPPIKAPISV